MQHFFFFLLSYEVNLLEDACDGGHEKYKSWQNTGYVVKRIYASLNLFVSSLGKLRQP